MPDDSSESPPLPGSQDPDGDGATAPAGPEPPPPLLTLRDGLPPVVETPEALALAARSLAGGDGPIAIDAERASGYRYSGRAYLVQIRRAGSVTALVDPTAFSDLGPLIEPLTGPEWVLHAATQDLPCLAEIGLRPTSLFDTELAGRLLGFPRVALATLVETLLGQRMRKEHSAVDWSTRPLPTSWLEYAALDVEVLLELRAELADRLAASGKLAWAQQEFTALLDFTPVVRPDAWRRTSGMHRLRTRRSLGAVRELWRARDTIAAQRDITPTRILPDSALVAAAQALPRSRSALLGTQGFHGRGAQRYAARWVDAIATALDQPEDALPSRSGRTDGPPTPRAWADKDPVAARRLALARAAVGAVAERQDLPVENLLTPDHLRRVLWAPPASRDPLRLADEVEAELVGLGARPWQVELTLPAVVTAILEADRPVESSDSPAVTPRPEVTPTDPTG